MRRNIVHEGAGELSYEIRNITKLAKVVEGLGKEILWENIGDPVAKGTKVPEWIKEIVATAAKEDASYGYSPTKGLDETRRFISDLRNTHQKRNIPPEDILFFNGLGDAVSKVYNYLDRNARVIGPSPAYPTHSSAEGAHAGSAHLTYHLNPNRNWLPDVEDLRNKVKYNPSIAGILIINPDNPTGMVYPRVVLKQIVEIAREFGLFIVCDEIYANISYGQEPFCSLAEVIGNDVPGIAMRGLSKEVPWPGSRCGWIEVYNKEKDENFARYVRSIEDAKMLEVCSTTLPQSVLPEIFSDPRYKKHLRDRANFYKRRAEEAYKILHKVPGITVVKPGGALYVSVVFDEGVLDGKEIPKIEDKAVNDVIREAAQGKPADQQFVYYALGSTGICVVPLSGFNSSLLGFRATLLEEDDAKFTYIFETLAKTIKTYLHT